MDLHDFYTGRTFDAHCLFGAHFEGDFVTFRTYAPGAQAVELIGEFNGWQGMPMAREGQGGVFSCRIQAQSPACCTNTKSVPLRAVRRTIATPMAFGWNFVRAAPPRSGLWAGTVSQTKPGWRRAAALSMRPSIFMRCISAPGKKTRPAKTDGTAMMKSRTS